MSRPTLYNLGTVNGVTAACTQDAWEALFEAQMRKNTLGVTGTHPLLISRIAAGMLTFVDAERWRESDLSRMFHTGTSTELEELNGPCEVRVVEKFPLEVPFGSGHIPTIQIELEQGFGPKPTLLAKLKEGILPPRVS